MGFHSILKVPGCTLVDRSGARQAPSRGSKRQKQCRDLPDSEVLPFRFNSRRDWGEGFQEGFPASDGWCVSAAVEVFAMFGLQRLLHNFFQNAQKRKHDLPVTLISVRSDWETEKR